MPPGFERAQLTAAVLLAEHRSWMMLVEVGFELTIQLIKYISDIGQFHVDRFPPGLRLYELVVFALE
jgi:hypothetical protein